MALWGNKDSKTASGTIAIADTGVVTGSSTSFTTQAKIGNYIRANGVDYEIVKITSNTAATVRAGTNGAAIAVVSGGTSYTLSEKPAFVAASEASNVSGWAGAGKAEAVFGVNATEVHAGGDNVTDVSIIQGGSGYVEVPAVSFSGGGGSSAAATATISGGKVTAVTVTNGGSSYETVPTVNINVPRLTVLMSAVTTGTDTISYTGHGLTAGEAIKYYANGGTAATGLTNATTYYAGQVTANAFKVYDTLAHATAAVSDKTIATSAVNTTDDTITITAHGYTTGVAVNYNRQGGTAITGLTSGTDYYVIKVDANTIKLAASADDATAGTAIDISGQGNNAQTLASVGRLDISGTGNDNQIGRAHV